jgi:hypothetical protein
MEIDRDRRRRYHGICARLWVFDWTKRSVFDQHNIGKATQEVIMAKRKKARKKGRKADRARVAAGQPHEVYYVARKFGVSADTVRKVIKRVGNSRAKIYAALEKM